MKKGFVIFALLLLSLSSASAVEFNINSQYKSGETIITKLSGNFLTPVTETNVKFYEGHVRVPMDYDIAKIGEEYYLYASLLGKTGGNYSVSIEGVKYMVGASTSEEYIVRNFTIANGTADFSLTPGFKVTSEDFFLQVQNLKDGSITVNVNTNTNTSGRKIEVKNEGTEYSLSLISGKIEKINFVLGTGTQSLQEITLSAGETSYKVPVYVFSSESVTPQQNTEESALMLEPASLIVSIPTNSVTKRTIFLYNTGNITAENITFTLSDEIAPFVNLSVHKIETLGGNSNLPIELSFYSVSELEIAGSLKANVNNVDMLYSQISLKFLANYIPPNVTEQTSSVKTCAELKGKICGKTEACDAQSVYAKDNVCCMGFCKSTAKSNSSGTIIAIIILVVIAGVGFFIYKKYGKAKKPVNLLNIAKPRQF